MGFLGVTFGEKHTYRDWHLKWTDVDIGYPEAKSYIVDIPGCSNIIDLSEALTGEIEYGTRELSFKFESPERNFYDWEKVKESIASYLHGRKLHIILDTDPKHYYVGRIFVEFSKSEKEKGELVIKATCEPYKRGSGDIKKL